MSRALTKSCEECGATFAKDPRYTHAYFARQRFCSQECFGRDHSRTMAERRPSLKEVFERHFTKTDGCWEWQGSRDKDGYGLLPYDGEILRANVVALELDGRPVPAGHYGCHSCDNPPCVRADHLYPGTPVQNAADAIARGRNVRGEAQHCAKLTADAVRKIRAAAGTHEEIAKAFGVARSNVSLIRERKTWRHIL